MKPFTKQIKASYPESSTSPLVEVNYFQSEEMFIIINENNEFLTVSQCNVSALIAMLQSVNSGVQ